MEQFPKQSTNYSSDLSIVDNEYAIALSDINLATNPLSMKSRRNEEIDRRLAVINAHFSNFIKKLIQENVQSQFFVALAQLGAGTAGTLTGKEASQLLSGLNALLTGGQQAYDKSALFDQTLPALVLQMFASRKRILVRIMDGRTKSINEYPLITAMSDLDQYYFAGSLPGAVFNTSTDATEKSIVAEQELAEISVSEFGSDSNTKLLELFIYEGGDPEKPISENVDKLRDWMENNNYPFESDGLADFLYKKSDLSLKQGRADAVKTLIETEPGG